MSKESQDLVKRTPVNREITLVIPGTDSEGAQGGRKSPSFFAITCFFSVHFEEL